MPARLALILSLVPLVGCAPSVGSGDAVDVGDLAGGKGDRATVELAFEVKAGEDVTVRLATLGRLYVDTAQDGTAERLQLIAESESYRRRSWRGRAPFLRIPGTRTGGDLTPYVLTIHNWGDGDARGTLTITVDEPDAPGVTWVANDPECAEEGCDPAGALRTTIVDALQRATRSIDAAVYGLGDPAILDALCYAAEAGVAVRMVADATESAEPGAPYHEAVEAAAACGVAVERTDYGAIMHDKFFVVDAGTDAATVITGSANLTTSGLDENHNHMIVIRGAPAIVDAFAAEHAQLFDHCRASGCDECTPACTADVSEEDGYEVAGASVRLFFSPSDGALSAIRGPAREAQLDAPDPTCGLGADCLCVPSGDRFRCTYCGEAGWGEIGGADARALVSLFMVTDVCAGLALDHARERGVETLVILDAVKAGSPYSQDENLCAMGVPTMLSAWAGGGRNHHKLLVLDDVVVTGSMNLSASGDDSNHENVLFIGDPALADELAAFVRDEAAALAARGVTAECPRASPGG